jgi:enoyl-CoA hydratase
MAAADEVLTVDIADRIAVLILDRPDKRNALDGTLLTAISDTLRAVDADDDVDVIVLTGRDPAFCAGLDLEWLAAGRLDWRPEPGQRGAFPPSMTKPVIGAINGPAVTGGFELALSCDFLVASEQARFADTHARVGVMPDWGLSVMLPQAIGVRRARMMSFTGNYLDARMAYEWGLVCEVTAHEDLLPRCLVLAAEIAGNDQEAVRHLRRTYAEVTSGDLREGWEREHELAAEWRQQAADRLASLDERRRAIIDRGSSQI